MGSIGQKIFYSIYSQSQKICNCFIIFQTFPSELTMWIDPLEVSYRIGENGSICVLYEHKASKKETTTDPSQPEAWRPTSTSNSTSSTATVVVSNASGMYEHERNCSYN